MAYNLTVLDPFEFEELVCDLFTEQLEEVVESFKVGADQGIDLRHICADTQKTLIFQCKRYDENKFSNLIKAIKKEKAKIGLLNPQRYILATSVPLNPKNKKEIYDELKPWCKSEGDIYGKNELNTLLHIHPSVLKKHFKLWISSTTILEHIFNAKTFNYTDNEIESFIYELPKMVIHEGFYKCKKLIEKYNHILISGDPGIGKTTVAKLLMLDFMSDGYQVAFVGTNIDEAWSLIHKTKEDKKKLAIVYDDFLGRTEFNQNKLTKNEDRRIVDLIKRCEKQEHIKLILTTREYIFEDAKRQHGALHENENEFEKYAIKLKDYTKKNKAQILFNHLYFSALPESKLAKFVESKIYNTLVTHKNFNPRIISTFCNSKIAREYSDEEFIDYIKNTFNNPVAIWEKPFNDDISETAKIILVVLLSLDGHSHIDELKELVSNTVKKSTNIEFENDFLHSLKQLEGNFTKTQKIKSESESIYIINFSNPSIEDFLINKCRRSPGHLSDIIESIQYIEQIINISQFILTKEPPGVATLNLIEILESRMDSLEQKFRKRPISATKSNSITWYSARISIFSILTTKLIFIESAQKKIPEDILEQMQESEFWSDAIRDSSMPANVTSELGIFVEYVKDSDFYDDEEKVRFEKSLRKSILTEENVDKFTIDLDDIINIEYSLTKVNRSLNYQESEFLENFVETRILPELVNSHDLDDLEHALNLVSDSFLRSSNIEDELSIRIGELEDVKDRMSSHSSGYRATGQDDNDEEIDLESMFRELNPE